MAILPDLSGKTVLVTGANTGIGRVTAIALAGAGAEVFLACRSEPKARAVIDEIAAQHPAAKARFLALDLASFASIRAAADSFLTEDKPLHILINNAGMAGPAGLTADGFQWTFGVNHLGHFLLTECLRDRIPEGGRIVNVSSDSHYRPRGIDWSVLREPVKTTTGYREYEVSKLANVLHAKALAPRVADRGITTYSLHPGSVATDVWRQIPWPVRPIVKRFLLTEEEGAQTTLYCATSDEVRDETGQYYHLRKAKQPSRAARDPALAEELWERSVAWTAA